MNINVNVFNEKVLKGLKHVWCRTRYINDIDNKCIVNAAFDTKQDCNNAIQILNGYTLSY